MLKVAAAFLVISPCFAYAEFETSYKQKNAQDYKSVAKTQGYGIVRELSNHSKSALASQMSHMNAYEKKKYISKMNQYYGTQYTVADFENTGSEYANNIRLTVENNSRAATVEHAVDLEAMTNQAKYAYGSSTPNGMDEATYQRMLKTQESAKASGQLGIDYAKQMTGKQTAQTTIQQMDGK